MLAIGSNQPQQKAPKRDRTPEEIIEDRIKLDASYYKLSEKLSLEYDHAMRRLYLD